MEAIRWSSVVASCGIDEITRKGKDVALPNRKEKPCGRVRELLSYE
jgi:hypothetical protein